RPVERLRARGTGAVEPAVSPAVRAGLRFAGDARGEPRALMRALQLSAAQAGVAFRTAYVRRIVHEKGRVRGVELDSEFYETPAGVLAARSSSSRVDGAA